MDGIHLSLKRKGFRIEVSQSWFTFIRRKDGSTAVEFALVAIPFFWMLIGMVELALYFTTSSLMADSANVGARLIRTGQIEQMAGDPMDNFRQRVCDRAAVFIPCDEIQLEVAVLAGQNYGDIANHGSDFDDNGNLASAGSYQQGGQNDVIMVRIAYRYPFFTPFIGPVLADSDDNTRLILNTIVVKNEPYQS